MLVCGVHMGARVGVLSWCRKKLYARRGATVVGSKEDHHGTRQRYTVMTGVESWHVPGADEPPRCAVLFKADTERARCNTPSSWLGAV